MHVCFLNNKRRGENRKTSPPPYTHTHILESTEKEKQHSRMQEKQSKVKNSVSEERKQSKNHCSPIKLVYSKCLNFYLIMDAFSRDIPNDVLPTRLTQNKWLLTLVCLF